MWSLTPPVVVVNPGDDVSALRVVNTPRRCRHECVPSRGHAVEMGLVSFRGGGVPKARALLGIVGLCGNDAVLLEFTDVIESARRYAGELSCVIEAIVDKVAGIIRVYEAEQKASRGQTVASRTCASSSPWRRSSDETNDDAN